MVKGHIARRSRAGRPKQPGDRYPSGRRKDVGDIVAPTLWRRIKDHAVALGLDLRMASEIGRLSLQQRLTDAECAVAEHVAAAYARCDRLTGKPRRSAVSPSYVRGYGGDPQLAEERLDPAERSEHERRVRRAVRRFERIQDCFPNAGARELVERICVEDRPIPEQHIPELKILLNRIGAKLGITAAAGIPRLSDPPRAAPPDRSQRKRQATLSVAAVARVIGVLRPDLADNAQVEATIRAIQDRERFRAGKAKTPAPQAPSPAGKEQP